MYIGFVHWTAADEIPVHKVLVTMSSHNEADLTVRRAMAGETFRGYSIPREPVNDSRFCICLSFLGSRNSRVAIYFLLNPVSRYRP